MEKSTLCKRRMHSMCQTEAVLVRHCALTTRPPERVSAAAVLNAGEQSPAFICWQASNGSTRLPTKRERFEMLDALRYKLL